MLNANMSTRLTRSQGQVDLLNLEFASLEIKPRRTISAPNKVKSLEQEVIDVPRRPGNVVRCPSPDENVNIVKDARKCRGRPPKRQGQVVLPPPW